MLKLFIGKFPISEACKTTTPIHCQWNSWVIGECSATCGEGTRTNTRAKKVVEKDGGTCSGLSKETLSCEEKECASMSNQSLEKMLNLNKTIIIKMSIFF
jgi:hypothetical protein